MLLTMPCHSYITNNTNTYTTYVSLYYLQCHAILTLLTIQTLTLLLLLTMPFHSYITNNTNSTSNTYTYNTNTKIFHLFPKKIKIKKNNKIK